MVKTLTNIDGGKVIAALKAAKPVTATGKVAVENFSKFMTVHRLTAGSLESALVSLESLKADVGLKQLIAMLKGLMPVAKRKVAVAYESIANEDKTLFLAASTEAEDKVATLYRYNADKIIDMLCNGYLDNFATNPAIAELIKYAKAARADMVNVQDHPIAFNGNEANVTVTLVPVLNVSMIGEASLVSIDGSLYFVGPNGAIDNAADLQNIELDATVNKLLTILLYLKPTAEPNILTLTDQLATVVAKNLSISKFEVDLLATNDAFVGINGNFMSVEKAQAILSADRTEVLAATLLNDDARTALSILYNIMSTLADYRGTLLTNMYAKKFSCGIMPGNDARLDCMLVKSGVYYNLIVKSDGVNVATKAYNGIMDVLSDDFVASNVPIFNAMQASYAADIDAAASKMNVRVKLAKDLANDISRLQELYESITEELDSLSASMDANPDKITALSQLKTKTEDKLKTAKQELDKLS